MTKNKEDAIFHWEITRWVAILTNGSNDSTVPKEAGAACRKAAKNMAVSLETVAAGVVIVKFLTCGTACQQTAKELAVSLEAVASGASSVACLSNYIYVQYRVVNKVNDRFPPSLFHSRFTTLCGPYTSRYTP